MRVRGVGVRGVNEGEGGEGVKTGGGVKMRKEETGKKHLKQGTPLCLVD